MSKKSSSKKSKKQPKKEKTALPKMAGIFASVEGFFLRLSLRDQIFFIKQLAVLLRAGIPIFTSLNILKKQSKSKSMHKIMAHVIKGVENGQYLSATLGKFKKVFGELTINIIAIGEVSGSLSNNLDYLALTLKKKQTLRRKVVSASVYPIFVIIATIAITIMLAVFVFPKILPVFKSMNYQLPWTTRFLIFINSSITNYGFLIAATIIIFIVAILLLLRIKKVHRRYDRILLSSPLISKLIQSYNVTNICRTIGLLLNSGTGVVRSFQITSNSTVNLLYKDELNRIADEIARGSVISVQMERNPKLFPSMMSQMVAVGESTGKLSDTFLYLAETHEEEMDELTKNLGTAVEPLLLIFMGILVGFIAISIITPIYGITQHLNPK